jgi:hypothetical protein
MKWPIKSRLLREAIESGALPEDPSPESLVRVAAIFRDHQREQRIRQVDARESAQHRCNSRLVED